MVFFLNMIKRDHWAHWGSKGLSTESQKSSLDSLKIVGARQDSIEFTEVHWGSMWLIAVHWVSLVITGDYRSSL